MIYFIRAIFFDLISRVDKMQSQLKSKEITSISANEFKIKTINVIESLHRRVNEIIISGDLDLAWLERNNIIRYNTFLEELLEIELFMFQVILKYDKGEEYFEKVITNIYSEIQCTQSTPLITTISNSENYYWAYPKYSIIAVPDGEEQNLLNLPDLYHEIAHLIYKQYKVFLIKDIETKVVRYYKRQKLDAKNNNNDNIISHFSHIETNWLNSWIEEYTCDLIGTYLVGTAYAWTNLKLTTVSSGSNRVFAVSESHPSDESRMRAIFSMLKLTGTDINSSEVVNSWDRFVNITANIKVNLYDFIFPDELIIELSKNVLAGCQAIGLCSYSEQLKGKSKPISKILNNAWEQILSKPEQFSNWEQKEIESIMEENS